MKEMDDLILALKAQIEVQNQLAVVIQRMSKLVKKLRELYGFA